MAIPDSLIGVIVGSVIAGVVTLTTSAIQYMAQNQRELMLVKQKLIETIQETIPEIISTAGWFYLSKMKDAAPLSVDGGGWDAEKTSHTLKLAHQITQVELMLDLDDEIHVLLKHRMNDVRMTAFASDIRQLTQFESAAHKLTNACSVVLKQARVNRRAWRLFK
jgi:hypothetical protein